jgi:hypothetical protein
MKVRSSGTGNIFFIHNKEKRNNFMCKYSSDLIHQYIKETGPFFQDDLLANVELETLIDMKGPFFLSTNDTENVAEIVKWLIKNFLDSKIEQVIGDWLEGLAIFINGKVYGGIKSGIKGIDLEFDNNNVRNIVSIKSGPNWGNSSQIEKMENNFKTAIKTLRTSNSNLQIICVNGCCYGKDNNPDKGTYYKYCGQRFWEYIGGNENIYIDIIEPLGHKAKERNENYLKQYSGKINIFVKEFIENFCNKDGSIDWEKLVKYNSGK